jgi:hypothetical protein
VTSELLDVPVDMLNPRPGIAVKWRESEAFGKSGTRLFFEENRKKILSIGSSVMKTCHGITVGVKMRRHTLSACILKVSRDGGT